jgi:hypothetical protein
MSLYHVEKTAVEVRLLLADGSRLAGSVFLSEFSPTHSGRQSLEDLMNEPNPFLAFTTAQGRFVLVGKEHVVAVETPFDAPSVSGFWSRLSARLKLTGGHTIEGRLWTREGPGIRFSDAVTGSATWVALETGRSLFWLAKARILTAEETDAPTPASLTDS